MGRSKVRGVWRRRFGARFSGGEPASPGVPLLRAGVCVVCIAFSAAALVWPHLEMVKIGYHLGRLERQKEMLLQERRVLRIEVAQHRQLKRIELIARKKMKMVFPAPGQIVYVKVGGGRN